MQNSERERERESVNITKGKVGGSDREEESNDSLHLLGSY